MARLIWDDAGKKEFHTGISNGVLYTRNLSATGSQSPWNTGVAWNGLTGVTENPEGADATDFWADNIKYASLRAAEDFGGTLKAYMYPDAFMACDGSYVLANGVAFGQQTRLPFCFAYMTVVGNDQNPEAGHMIHVIYNATVSPSDKEYTTINDSPSILEFSWDLKTTPLNVAAGIKPTSMVTVDSTKLTGGEQNANWVSLYNDLFGLDADSTASPAVDAIEPHIVLPDAIYTLFGGAAG